MLFFVFSLFLISQVCANQLLITCNVGCGCVTENRTAVSCPFIQSSETVVLRAKPISRGRYEVFRVVPINFEPVIEEDDSDLSPGCPTEAGTTIEDSVKICSSIDFSTTARFKNKKISAKTRSRSLDKKKHTGEHLKGVSRGTRFRFKGGCKATTLDKKHWFQPQESKNWN